MYMADWNFYKTKFFGQAIQNEDTFNYLKGLALDYIKKEVDPLPDNESAKRCVCRVADILKNADATRGKQSESVGGVYSVTYNNQTKEEVNTQISNAINLYLGKYMKSRVIDIID